MTATETLYNRCFFALKPVIGAMEINNRAPNKKKVKLCNSIRPITNAINIGTKDFEGVGHANWK